MVKLRMVIVRMVKLRIVKVRTVKVRIVKVTMVKVRMVKLRRGKAKMDSSMDDPGGFAKLGFYQSIDVSKILLWLWQLQTPVIYSCDLISSYAN